MAKVPSAALDGLVARAVSEHASAKVDSTTVNAENLRFIATSFLANNIGWGTPDEVYARKSNYRELRIISAEVTMRTRNTEVASKNDTPQMTCQ